MTPQTPNIGSKCGDDILEYTLDGEEIAVDWVSGRNVATMLQALLNAEGEGIARISGYVTDKLDSAPDRVLRRFGTYVATQLGDQWKASLETIEGRRYLVFRK